MADAADISPPWGALPVEQFLIVRATLINSELALTCCQRNWEQYPNLPAPERRQQLVQDFLRLDVIPREWDAVRSPQDVPVPLDIRVPTEDEIEAILRPWRPMSVRSVAAYIWASDGMDFADSVWIRTHYDAGQEDAWNSLLLESPGGDLFNEWMTVPQGLSEADMFASDGLTPEEAWLRALLYLPEFASKESIAAYDRHPPGIDDVDEDLDELRAQARDELQNSGPPKPRRPEECYTGDYEATERLQYCFLQRSVVIVDAEAFETGKVCVLALDVRGNVVRWMRLVPEEIQSELDTYAHEGMFQDAGWLNEVEGVSGVGVKYHPDGGELAAFVYGFHAEGLDAGEE